MKYHINARGESSVCSAEIKCTLVPADGVTQFHGSRAEVDSAIEGAYQVLANRDGLLRGVRKHKFSKSFEVSDDLIGSVETDADRLSVSSSVVRSFGVVSHMWLHDVEGRPIGYINVAVSDGELFLYDIEIRSEFRGRGLSSRLIKAVELSSGMKMQHEGGYTAAGLATVAKHFRDDAGIESEKGQLYDDMTFVADWDNELPITGA